MNVAVLRIRASLRRRRRRLARGSVGEHLAQERRELADIAITAHFSPAVEELGNLPLPIDELKGAATSRLEQARIDAVIESAVPRVDVERDFRAAENSRHVIRREKAVREPCAKARSRGEFFPPRAEDTHVELTGEAFHHLFAQRAPVAREADVTSVFRARRRHPMHGRIASGRQEIGLRHAGAAIVLHTAGRVRAKNIVVACLAQRALELERVVDPPTCARDTARAQIFEGLYRDIDTEDGDEYRGPPFIDHAAQTQVDAAFFLCGVALPEPPGQSSPTVVEPIQNPAVVVEHHHLVPERAKRVETVTPHGHGPQVAGNREEYLHAGNARPRVRPLAGGPARPPAPTDHAARAEKTRSLGKIMSPRPRAPAPRLRSDAGTASGTAGRRRR